MDRLGDLSQFDGHYSGPYIAEHGCIYCDGGNGEVAQVDLLANMTAEEYDATTRLLAAAPDLLAALKESRKENEELRERIESVKRLCEAGLDAVDRDLPSPGCCETIADILVELEGKQ